MQRWGLTAATFDRLQEFIRFGVELRRKLSDYLDTYVIDALFKLAQIAAADLGLMGQFILGPAFCVAQSA